MRMKTHKLSAYFFTCLILILAFQNCGEGFTTVSSEKLAVGSSQPTQDDSSSRSPAEDETSQNNQPPGSSQPPAVGEAPEEEAPVVPPAINEPSAESVTVTLQFRRGEPLNIYLNSSAPFQTSESVDLHVGFIDSQDPLEIYRYTDGVLDTGNRLNLDITAGNSMATLTVPTTEQRLSFRNVINLIVGENSNGLPDAIQLVIEPQDSDVVAATGYRRFLLRYDGKIAQQSPDRLLSSVPESSTVDLLSVDGHRAAFVELASDGTRYLHKWVSQNWDEVYKHPLPDGVVLKQLSAPYANRTVGLTTDNQIYLSILQSSVNEYDGVVTYANAAAVSKVFGLDRDIQIKKVGVMRLFTDRGQSFARDRVYILSEQGELFHARISANIDTLVLERVEGIDSSPILDISMGYTNISVVTPTILYNFIDGTNNQNIFDLAPFSRVDFSQVTGFQKIRFVAQFDISNAYLAFESKEKEAWYRLRTHNARATNLTLEPSWFQDQDRLPYWPYGARETWTWDRNYTYSY